MSWDWHIYYLLSLLLYSSSLSPWWLSVPASILCPKNDTLHRESLGKPDGIWHRKLCFLRVPVRGGPSHPRRHGLPTGYCKVSGWFRRRAELQYHDKSPVTGWERVLSQSAWNSIWDGVVSLSALTLQNNCLTSLDPANQALQSTVRRRRSALFAALRNAVIQLSPT